MSSIESSAESSASTSWKTHLHSDLSAALVVFLVALPLCLGIALASGAPLFSGLVSGVVGGVVVGLLSKSSLSVSGPAAGLTVIVLAALQSLPSYEAFLLAVVLAGVFQIGFGLLRAGVIGDFIPSSVIKGMLAAIGAILILKQLPHAVGYDKDFAGSLSFAQQDGHNTLSTLLSLPAALTFGAVAISAVSLVFLFWWDHMQPRLKKSALRFVPGPLIVVGFGVLANYLFQTFQPAFALSGEHLVSVPVMRDLPSFLQQFHMPDFGVISNAMVWKTAVTLAVVASLETLIGIEAIDKLDPYKRVTPTNRELMAQGAGNIICGFLGGLPVTSVVVRSSANVSAGGRTRLSAVIHGLFLFVAVMAIPTIINMVPLSSLAAVLIAVGYKLTKPAIFMQKFSRGWENFIPFVVTFGAILLTDLLTGICVGVVVGLVFVLLQNFHKGLHTVVSGNEYLIRCHHDLFFIHKPELKRVLDSIPDNAKVSLDLQAASFIDLDNIETIQDFMESAAHRHITVTVLGRLEKRAATAQPAAANESGKRAA